MRVYFYIVIHIIITMISPDSQQNAMWKKAILTIQKICLNHREYHSLSIHPEHHHILFVHLEESTIKENPPMIVYFCARDKLNIDALKEVITTLESYQAKHCFLVYTNVMTSSAKKALLHIFQYQFEIWNIKELQYDLTEHYLYVPHRKVDPEEYPQHFTQVSVIQQLPKISKNDAVVRLFAFEKNDVLQIQRKDGSLAYRIVK